MVKSSFRGLNMAVEGGHEDAATSGTVKRAVLSPAGNNRWVSYFGQSQVWSKANASGGPGRLKLGNWTNRPMSANGHTRARTHTCAHTHTHKHTHTHTHTHTHKHRHRLKHKHTHSLRV